MTTLTVTAKGQITLKRAILERLGIRPGQKVAASFLPNGHLEISPLIEPGPDIRAARGMLYRSGRAPLTIEDMQKAIEAGASGERRSP